MNLPAITRSLLSALVIFLGLNISGGGNHGIAVAQTWQNVPSKSGSSGTWQALSCNTTSNQTWQPLGCNPVTYTCPAGYTLSGQTCSMTVLSSAIPNYYCASGVLSGTNCVTSSSYAATPNYYCPSGGSLSGTTCVIPASSYAATATTSTSTTQASAWWVATRCPSQNRAVNQTTHLEACMVCRASGMPMLMDCSMGFTPAKPTCTSGTLVVVSATNAYCNVTSTSIVYSCPSGGVLSGSTCNIPSSSYAPTIASRSCVSGGVLSGSSCTITNSSAASISSYYCISGVLIGSQCSTTVTVPATANH